MTALVLVIGVGFTGVVYQLGRIADELFIYNKRSRSGKGSDHK